jgi:hypothetical protein
MNPLAMTLRTASLSFDMASLGVCRDAWTTARHRPLVFRFCVDEVPFEARALWRDNRVVLSLAGALGTLPFTIESGQRRRRLAMILAAAARGSGLAWTVDQRHEMTVAGDAELAAPVTPTALISGVVALLLRCRPYLELLVAAAAEAACDDGGTASTSPG